MSGINKVILVGQVGEDPEFRVLNDSVAIASFPLTTCESFNKNGVQVEQTECHKIIMWRTLAESAAKTLKKGVIVYLEGKARTRSFEDASGIKRYVTEIVADNFRPLNSTSMLETEFAGSFAEAKNL